MNMTAIRMMRALVGSVGLLSCVGIVALSAMFLATGAAGATTVAPHEHLPHTSSALKDIGTFTKTFEAPAPTPDAPTTPINAQRVRLANTLPPSNRLSAPIIVLAAVLVLLGFLLHPFRKARRQKHAHQPHDYEIPDLPEPETTAEIYSLEELALKIGSNQ
jgi:hypothetical protein